ncbi:hypothetical protein Tco_1427031, partial [Tanacetum coccineum]
ILNMVPTKKVDKTPYESWYEKVHNLSYLKVWGCEALMKRDAPGKLQQRSNKIVVARYAEFLEKNRISQEVSGREVELEEVQDKDTSPSENTSKNLVEAEGFKPPQEDVALVHRSERTHQAPQRLCLNVKVEEHSLGDLNEPINYKVALLDLESNRAIRILIDMAANTKDMFLVYGENPAELRVTCYYDAGFETDRDDIKSQTRYVFVLNEGAIDWKISKQSTTTMSATEAEYIACFRS